MYIVQKNIKILFILFAILTLIQSCKDKPIDTPIPTEVEDAYPNFVDTGANMVAYKVDGKIRVAKNISKLDTSRGFFSCGYFYHDYPKLFFFIAQRFSDESYESIQIDIQDLFTTGEYIIASPDTTSYFGIYNIGSNENNAKQFTTTDEDSGYVYITKIDTIKGFVAGRFEFTARYIFGSSKKRITEGRFDLKYYRNVPGRFN